MFQNQELKAIKKGNQKAFETVFLHHCDAVTKFLEMFLKDTQKAHERAQDVFVELWETRSELNTKQSVKNALFPLVKKQICKK